MNGFLLTGKRFLQGFGFLLLFSPCPSMATEIPGQVTVLVGSHNIYFNQTIETMVASVGTAARFKVLTIDQIEADDPEIKAGGLIVALGQPAIETVRTLAPQTPRVNAFVTQEQYRQDLPRQTRETTVLLDQPLLRYLMFCRLLLGIDSVGVMTDTALELNDDQTKLLPRQGLRVHQSLVTDGANHLRILRKLLDRNDAVLMLPRRMIYNRNTLKGVLLTGYRALKPLISYSPAHVKAGALASIYSSPKEIGLQLAEIVSARLKGVRKQLPSPQFAQRYSIKTNQRVAHALGLVLPDIAKIRLKLDRLLK